MAKAKMSLKQFEKSAADKKMDKKLNLKEGSKADKSAEKKAMAGMKKKK